MIVEDKIRMSNMLDQYLDGEWVLARTATLDEISKGEFDTAFNDDKLVCVIKVNLDSEVAVDSRIFMLKQNVWDKMCSTEILKSHAIKLAKYKRLD